MPSAIDLELERAREVDDHAHERALLAAAGEAVDERLGDLEDVERQRVQVAERRVAGAEVVEREPHAELAQLVQRRRARVGVPSSALGDLEHELAAGRGRRRRAPRATRLEQVGVAAARRAERFTCIGSGSPSGSRPASARLAAGLARARSGRAATIRPVSSASGTNSRRQQRGRASGGPSARAPRRRRRRRVASATIGWYSTTISPRSTACCELLLEAVAAQDRASRICGSKTLEAALARAPWPGTSRRRRCGSARPRRGASAWSVAMPTLRCTEMQLARRPATGCSNASQDPLGDDARRPRRVARRPWSITANSSPPRRATVSAGRTQARRRSATATSSSSPTAWPSVSLTVLKSSRSMNSTATSPASGSRAPP